MHAPDIERIVPSEFVLQRASVIAHYARRRPDDDGRGRGDVARCGRDRRETCYGAGE